MDDVSLVDVFKALHNLPEQPSHLVLHIKSAQCTTAYNNEYNGFPGIKTSLLLKVAYEKLRIKT